MWQKETATFASWAVAALRFSVGSPWLQASGAGSLAVRRRREDTNLAANGPWSFFRVTAGKRPQIPLRTCYLDAAAAARAWEDRWCLRRGEPRYGGNHWESSFLCCPVSLVCLDCDGIHLDNPRFLFRPTEYAADQRGEQGMRRLSRKHAISAVMAMVLGTGCQSPYHADQGALFGGLVGAGSGAIIGNQRLWQHRGRCGNWRGPRRRLPVLLLAPNSMTLAGTAPTWLPSSNGLAGNLPPGRQRSTT